MVSFSIKKIKCLHECLTLKASSFTRSMWRHIIWLYRYLVFHCNPFWIQLCYFISISFVGFLALKILRPIDESTRPNSFDLFFMSVSAITVSSMSTVEMEVFSVSQLWVLILLMLVGGEIFISMFDLQLMKGKLEQRTESASANLESSDLTNLNNDHLIELSLKVVDDSECNTDVSDLADRGCPKQDSVRYLRFVVLAYLVLVVASGSAFISIYLSFATSAGDVLRKKRIPISTFSIFTTVSSFGNCGFIPTNENMIVFKKDSALMLLIIPQILTGNTLFPPCLRFMIWVLKKVTKRGEFSYILQNPRAIRYKHLLSHKRSVYLTFTVLGFIVVQLLLFCFLEWNSEALRDLESYQKVIAALFQSVNSRYAGESAVDISSLSPAILVLYIVMIEEFDLPSHHRYLPPYTSFFPFKDDDLPPLDKKEENKIRDLLKFLIFSQLSYIAIFVILVCITERKAMLEDPLNFNVLNIVFEVISAYGNVGFSTGYSCRRSLKPDCKCKDVWYGFSGKWSKNGKLILIVVMIFGRLKYMGGGKAWKLS